MEAPEETSGFDSLLEDVDLIDGQGAWLSPFLKCRKKGNFFDLIIIGASYSIILDTSQCLYGKPFFQPSLKQVFLSHPINSSSFGSSQQPSWTQTFENHRIAGHNKCDDFKYLTEKFDKQSKFRWFLWIPTNVGSSFLCIPCDEPTLAQDSWGTYSSSIPSSRNVTQMWLTILPALIAAVRLSSSQTLV